MKVSITFEVSDDALVYEKCMTLMDSVHEALCLAIHEGSMTAIAWLEQNVENVIGGMPSHSE